MFLSRVEIAWEDARNPYKLHKKIWTLFPGAIREPRKKLEEDRQGFLFRIEESLSGKTAKMLVQSKMPPITAGDNIIVHAVKEFNPRPRAGQRLAFILIANPVKTISDKNERLTQKGEIKKCRVPLIKEEERYNWLHDKLKGVACPKIIKVQPLSPIFFQKKGHVGKLSPVLFEGIIQVDNPQLFIKLLENGIGPAKAFGCGLMLVKRI